MRWVILSVATVAAVLGVLFILLVSEQRPTTSGQLTERRLTRSESRTRRASGSAFAASASRRTPQLPHDDPYIAEHDQDSDRYDPTSFAMSAGNFDVPWTLESRIEPWASSRELSINRWLSEHLTKAAPKAELKAVTCKRRLCRVEVAIPAEHVHDITGRYPVFMLSPSTTISSADNGNALFYLAYPASLIDDSRFNEYVTRSLEQLAGKGVQ